MDHDSKVKGNNTDLRDKKKINEQIDNPSKKTHVKQLRFLSIFSFKLRNKTGSRMGTVIQLTILLKDKYTRAQHVKLRNHKKIPPWNGQ